MIRFFSTKQLPNQQQLFALLLVLALLLAQSLGALHRSEHAGSLPSSGTQTQSHTHSHSHGHAHDHQHEHSHEHEAGHEHEHAHEHPHDHEQHASNSLFAHEQGSDCLLFDALSGSDAYSFAAPVASLPACAAQRPNSRFTTVTAQRLAGAKPARGPPSQL